MGNKIDLAQERQVTLEEAKAFANGYGINYFEASAKENIGVKRFINYIMDKTYKNKYPTIESLVIIDKNDLPFSITSTNFS